MGRDRRGERTSLDFRGRCRWRPTVEPKVINSEPDILTVFGEVMDTADHVTWALDLVDGPAALLLGILANHGQSPRYVTGSKFAAFKKSFSGQGKSDLKDSYVVAEFARCLRRQTVPVPAPPRITKELTLILSHRKWPLSRTHQNHQPHESHWAISPRAW
ncbi:transposase [Streptomyces sp. NPDC087849]|uniref:IS110 family transposase n=1 Tax=Streptomyces sp. NPDC087849 TaxID=3365808 RepID=UPI00382652A2